MLKTLMAAVLFCTAFAMTPALAEETKYLRSISVSGHGEVQAVPDLATISIGVSTQGAAAREALDANSKAMKALLDMLKGAGIDAHDLTTTNFSVGPRMDYGNNNGQPPKVVGYDVNNMVMVTVRKIDDLGGLLDVAVTTGSNSINGISFSVSKPDEKLDDARKAAMADAKRKADVYAAAGGFKIGKIVSVSEGGSYQPPVTYMAKAARGDGANDVPLAQGEQTLAVDVSVTYELQ